MAFTHDYKLDLTGLDVTAEIEFNGEDSVASWSMPEIASVTSERNAQVDSLFQMIAKMQALFGEVNEIRFLKKS